MSSSFDLSNNAFLSNSLPSSSVASLVCDRVVANRSLDTIGFHDVTETKRPGATQPKTAQLDKHVSLDDNLKCLKQYGKPIVAKFNKDTFNANSIFNQILSIFNDNSFNAIFNIQ